MDLFSLDIEGAEEAVLNTIPWDKVDIEILLIEVMDTQFIDCVFIEIVDCKLKHRRDCKSNGESWL